MINFRPTHGTHSRNCILNDFYVLWIRAEYDSGRRGATEAERFGITPSHYNRIGRRQAWRHLFDGDYMMTTWGEGHE